MDLSFWGSPNPLQALCINHAGDRERSRHPPASTPGRLLCSETSLHILRPLVPSSLATGPLHRLSPQPGTLSPPLFTDSFLISSELRLASWEMFLQAPMLDQTLATNPYNTQNLSLVKLVMVVI